MKKCELDIDQATIAKIKRQMAKGEIDENTLKVLSLRKDYLEKVGFEKFLETKSLNAQYEEINKEGSFLIERNTKEKRTVRCIFKVKTEDKKIVLALKVIEIDTNFYREED